MVSLYYLNIDITSKAVSFKEAALLAFRRKELFIVSFCYLILINGAKWYLSLCYKTGFLACSVEKVKKNS